MAEEELGAEQAQAGCKKQGRKGYFPSFLAECILLEDEPQEDACEERDEAAEYDEWMRQVGDEPERRNGKEHIEGSVLPLWMALAEVPADLHHDEALDQASQIPCWIIERKGVARLREQEEAPHDVGQVMCFLREEPSSCKHRIAPVQQQVKGARHNSHGIQPQSAMHEIMQQWLRVLQDGICCEESRDHEEQLHQITAVEQASIKIDCRKFDIKALLIMVQHDQECTDNLQGIQKVIPAVILHIISYNLILIKSNIMLAARPGYNPSCGPCSAASLLPARTRSALHRCHRMHYCSDVQGLPALQRGPSEGFPLENHPQS